jgi:hypothetical protein
MGCTEGQDLKVSGFTFHQLLKRNFNTSTFYSAARNACVTRGTMIYWHVDCIAGPNTHRKIWSEELGLLRWNGRTIWGRALIHLPIPCGVSVHENLLYVIQCQFTVTTGSRTNTHRFDSLHNTLLITITMKIEYTQFRQGPNTSLKRELLSENFITRVSNS